MTGALSARLAAETANERASTGEGFAATRAADWATERRATENIAALICLMLLLRWVEGAVFCRASGKETKSASGEQGHAELVQQARGRPLELSAIAAQTVYRIMFTTDRREALNAMACLSDLLSRLPA